MNLNLKRGFTLIELIIVMAILGVLAVISLALIDPVERTAQARDSNRITSVAQIGRALQAYYTQESAYPVEATWAQDLVETAGITFPTGSEYSANSILPCTANVQPFDPPTYCYLLDATNGALVFAAAESESNLSRCATGEPYFVFSTADGRGGTVCSVGEPTVWATGTQVYVN